MLLENKTAIVYGAAGPIGSAVARAYAREGAHVHLAGRTIDRLDEVAATIRNAEGTADVAEVDLLDLTALQHHTASIVAAKGSIDTSLDPQRPSDQDRAASDLE